MLAFQVAKTMRTHIIQCVWCIIVSVLSEHYQNGFPLTRGGAGADLGPVGGVEATWRQRLDVVPEALRQNPSLVVILRLLWDLVMT